MPKKSTAETRQKLRTEFYENLHRNQTHYDIPTALKAMRRIAGMTQREYAEFCKVAPRTVIDLERGVGNPTLATLEALLKPFRLKLTIGLAQETHETLGSAIMRKPQ